MINALKGVPFRGATIRNASMVVLAAGTVALTASASEARPRRDWRDANASISSGHSFSGMASYYGNESGSKTASGQRFNQNAMTAAHRSLPFGTRLRVTHNGHSVVVTVNDRGPFVRGRVLDLSKGAARAIGLTGRGVGRVVAEVQ
ncbi:septal ring lytic transglycosylase RlpA family protein [Bradyrhizobium sp. SYSU BS000235]|uniref:septal ring lytic transglycosylase RlpA family protein n=1 Tax=Bradyrhizobium sp. SYSU BS000235 TaxID=3411332 RepID=UPI003C75F38F